MKRAPWLLVLLMLAACGSKEPPKPAPPKGPVSMLSKYDGGPLLQGLELPDFTEYWRNAEARNGNTYPVLVKPGAEHTLVVRLTRGGRMELAGDKGFTPIDLEGLRAALAPLVAATLAEGRDAASGTLIVLPQQDASFANLAAICQLCVRVKLGNLLLGTRDNRDGACRLLGLVVNTERELDPWLGRAPVVPRDAVRIEAAALPVARLRDGKTLPLEPLPGYGAAITAAIAEAKPRPRTVQLCLQRHATMADMAAVMHELAGTGLAKVEPFWPLAEDLHLIDATRHWQQRDAAEVEQALPGAPGLHVRVARDGTVAVDTLHGWDESGVAGLRMRLSELQPPARVVTLFCDVEAPWVKLLEICHVCVELQADGLSLATTDSKAGKRLVPLLADRSQAGLARYTLQPEHRADVVGLDWRGEAPRFHLPDGSVSRATGPANWGRALRDLVAGLEPRPRRVQVDLPPGATLRGFEAALHELAPGQFQQVEPWWPALFVTPDAEPPPVRILHEFTDDHGVLKRVNPPTLGAFWRGVQHGTRLPESARVDANRPLLLVSVGTDGRWGTCGRDGQWREHTDDAGVREAIENNLGEISPEGTSRLQVVLAADRGGHWRNVLGVLEMMVQARCSTLYLLTMDQVGPTPRLLDLSLPMTEAESPIAELQLEREGSVHDGNYNAMLRIDGEPNPAQGPRYLATLSGLVARRTAPVATLIVSLPHDEPIETFGHVLNALSGLAMRGIRIAP